MCGASAPHISHSCSMVRATCPSQERMASSVPLQQHIQLPAQTLRPLGDDVVTEHPAANFLSLNFFFRLLSSIS